MAHGGKREGAGRKPGYKAKVAEAYTELLAKKVEANQEALASSLVNKALTGDIPAHKEINERVLGKVKDEMNLVGNLTHIFNDLPDETLKAIILREAGRIKVSSE